MYDKVLKEDGEHQYVRESEEDYRFKEFDLAKYKQTNRPIIISGLNYLAIDIIKLTRKLDSYAYADQYYVLCNNYDDVVLGAKTLLNFVCHIANVPRSFF